MGPEAILLSLGSTGREGTYRFTCPTCQDRVEKRADRKIVALLVSAGVDVAGPAPAGQPQQPELEEVTPEVARTDVPEGPPLTYDDLIEFHFLLEDDDNIDGFFAAQ